MKIYYESTGQNTFDFLPLTFHIKEGESDKEFSKFEDVFSNTESHPDLQRHPKLGNNLWIVKPGENTNRGCGI